MFSLGTLNPKGRSEARVGAAFGGAGGKKSGSRGTPAEFQEAVACAGVREQTKLLFVMQLIADQQHTPTEDPQKNPKP